MKESELRHFIREVYKEFEEEMEEITTTGNVAGFQTPHAFAGDDDEEPDSEYVKKLNRSTGYKQVDETAAPKNWETYKSTKEQEEEYANRWLELKKSDKTPNQKIGVGVRRIRNDLTEMEKFVRWYSKIRKMNELGKDQYWKRTQKHLKAIREKLISFARKIQELEAPLDELTESKMNERKARKNWWKKVDKKKLPKIASKEKDSVGDWMITVKRPDQPDKTLIGQGRTQKEAYADALNKASKEMADMWMKESVNEENPCWDGYEMIGMKMQNGKEVPNCVPIEEAQRIKETIRQKVRKAANEVLHEAAQLNEKKYRLHITTKNGEKFKSKEFPNKKEAQDYHWKLSKKNKFKSIDLVPVK